MSSIYLFQNQLDDASDDLDEAQLSDKSPKQRFCCTVCQLFITDDRYKTAINHQHVFTKINPQQQQFSFACFSAAEGCQQIGQLTHADSWFMGYRWRFAHCKQCSTQLGWQFVGESTFYGLILQQLIDCSSNE